MLMPYQPNDGRWRSYWLLEAENHSNFLVFHSADSAWEAYHRSKVYTAQGISDNDFMGLTYEELDKLIREQ